MTLLRRYPIVLTTITACVIALSLFLAGYETPARWVAILYVGAIIAWTTIDMVRDILRGHWGLDILAVVAMVATLATGEYAAAMIVSLMLTGGEALEDYAQYRARDELSSLLKRSPVTAHVLPTPEEAPVERDVNDVNVGDLLVIRPAEIVPVDVELVSISAEVDTSSITGESLPRVFHAGDEVPSGVINGVEAITARCLRPASESQYQRIISLVQQAQEEQAPIVRLADRFAVPFTVFSLALAALAWWVAADATRFAQVLVLATPCPLLIAAPVAFLGGLSQTAKNGVVVKGGAVLEALSRIKTAGFDKTGTLTRGTPQLVDIHPAPEFTSADVLQLAASAERLSTHVFASGIIEAATNKGLNLIEVSAAQEIATAGVQATVNNRVIRVGKASFVKEALHSPHHFLTPDLRPGQTLAYVAVDGRFAGALVLTDPPREEAQRVVSWIKQTGATPIMLTGDAQKTAMAIAQDVGIDHVHADLLPEHKVEVLRASAQPCLMVGDGVNDAPVLASATVGIAMGAQGATAAGEAADAVVLRDDLGRVADTVHMARHTVSVALSAIWIGIGLSVALMGVAAFGAIPAVVGALLQEIVDLAAILYALRARRVRPVFTSADRRSLHLNAA